MSGPPSQRSGAPDLRDIVTANDVRGVAGESLTVPILRALGAAFADHLDGAAVVLAHDNRLSSPELAAAFAEGAARRGSVVAAAGLASTDQLYCASGLHRAAGAMITASHNPPRDNGVKLCLPGAAPIGRDTGLDAIRERAERYLAEGVIPERPGGRIEGLETLQDYVTTLLGLVSLPPTLRLRVVVDAANAMAGLTVPAIAARIPGLEIIPLHMELDGTFPHHGANPLVPENLADLRATVLRDGADLGLAFDGDGDRCVAVDEHGRVIAPSTLTALIAGREIARARAAGEETPVVVANLVSSRHVTEVIERGGGRRIRSRVGHSLIKALMAEHNAIFGGEHSAHYYFRDFFFADSGMLAALHLLAALAESSGPASALVAEHSPYAASGEINSRVEDAAAARDAVRAYAARIPGARIDELDGVSIDHWDDAADAEENWWASVRSSNTEPLLRLNVEAARSTTMERVREELLAVIRAAPQPHDGVDSSGADGPTGTSTGMPRGGVMGRDLQDRAPAAASGADLPAWVRERLRCPRCRAHLDEARAALVCESCGRRYPVTDGIAMLIADDGQEAPGRA